MEILWDAIQYKVLFAMWVFCFQWIQWLINCDVSSGKFEERQVHG